MVKFEFFDFLDIFRRLSLIVLSSNHNLFPHDSRATQVRIPTPPPPALPLVKLAQSSSTPSNIPGQAAPIWFGFGQASARPREPVRTGASPERILTLQYQKTSFRLGALRGSAVLAKCQREGITPLLPVSGFRLGLDKFEPEQSCRPGSCELQQQQQQQRSGRARQ